MLTPNQITVLLGYKKIEKGVRIGSNTLTELINSTNIKRQHLGVAYSYLYLVTWLYRHCKHYSLGFSIDNSTIKQILGYSSRNQTFNYLIKKNGVLDSLGLTETTRDVPTSWRLYESKEGKKIMFFYQSDLSKDEMLTMPKRYYAKKPLKALRHRSECLLSENSYKCDEKGFKGDDVPSDAPSIEGTFNDVSNTYYIPFEAFIFCMSKDDIGCTGFLLYSHIKHKNDYYGSGYDVSIDSLATETGVNRRTVVRYMNALKAHRLVSVQLNQDFYVPNKEQNERRPNTYTSNSPSLFSSDAIEYPKMRAKSQANYEKYREALNEVGREFYF